MVTTTLDRSHRADGRRAASRRCRCRHPGAIEARCRCTGRPGRRTTAPRPARSPAPGGRFEARPCPLSGTRPRRPPPAVSSIAPRRPSAPRATARSRRARRGAERRAQRRLLLEHELRRRQIAEACPWIADQAAAQQRANRGRHLRRQQRPVGLARQNGGENLPDVSARERSPPGQHLEQDAPERPHVAALVGCFPAHLLGRHVGGRADLQPPLSEGGRGEGGR